MLNKEYHITRKVTIYICNESVPLLWDIDVPNKLQSYGAIIRVQPPLNKGRLIKRTLTKLLLSSSTHPTLEQAAITSDTRTAKKAAVTFSSTSLQVCKS